VPSYIQPSGSTILDAGDIDADLTSGSWSVRQGNSGEPFAFYVAWTNNDTPTGILYMQESFDESTWYNVKIPVAAVHDASNATLASGAISIAGGGYVVLHIEDLPRYFRFFYDWTVGGTTPDTMTVEAI